MEKFSFNYKKKKITIDVRPCKGIFSKGSGLMFRNRSPPLLFLFKTKKRRQIHSFFCRPFVAVWFDENKIIDVKIIKNWRVSINPREKFNKLLEIPLTENAADYFTDGKRNI